MWSDYLQMHVNRCDQSRRHRLFNASCSRQDAQVLIFPVPWEVTASYGGGASEGPLSILSASAQLDYWDHEFGDIRSREYIGRVFKMKLQLKIKNIKK